MTREEAIRQLQSLRDHCRTMIRDEYEDGIWALDIAALDLALSALRPVSREQVERMRGEWKNFKPLIECQICGEIYNRYGENKEKPFDFCPACGAPMTDEAVQMVMERLEAQYESVHNN